MASALFAAAQAHASLVSISSLDTGAGQYDANNGAVLTDPNWTVSLLSSSDHETPPGGNPNGAAYLVPNNIGFPFGYWAPNDTTSSWLTYSTPTQVGGDNTSGMYQYQLTFTPANSGVVNVSWLSDNGSWLYVNGGGYNNVQIGSKPGTDYSTFQTWNTPVGFNVTAGTQYTVDLDVFNAPQGYGNPTGGRVEFTGDVSVDPVDSPSAVPEPATLISGALMLLPFGASLVRILRRNQPA